jgi:ribosomal protein S18 acetylase RimI-like enzyme
MSLLVRAMKEADVEQVAALANELGYPVPLSEVRARFALLSGDRGSALLVAERQSVVIGFLHLAVCVQLTSAIHTEILTLSVTGQAHRSGAGRALVDQAIQLTKERGLSSIRVRSNVSRDVSHVFYAALGFTRTKTQHMYSLTLA